MGGGPELDLPSPVPPAPPHPAPLQPAHRHTGRRGTGTRHTDTHTDTPTPTGIQSDSDRETDRHRDRQTDTGRRRTGTRRTWPTGSVPCPASMACPPPFRHPLTHHVRPRNPHSPPPSCPYSHAPAATALRVGRQPVDHTAAGVAGRRAAAFRPHRRREGWPPGAAGDTYALPAPAPRESLITPPHPTPSYPHLPPTQHPSLRLPEAPAKGGGGDGGQPSQPAPATVRPEAVENPSRRRRRCTGPFSSRRRGGKPGPAEREEHVDALLPPVPVAARHHCGRHPRLVPRPAVGPAAPPMRVEQQLLDLPGGGRARAWGAQAACGGWGEGGRSLRDAQSTRKRLQKGTVHGLKWCG